MKTPYTIRPEGTDASINELALRHRQAENYYRDTAKSLSDKNHGAADWFLSLADYRRTLYTDLNKVIADISSGVHTPSHEGMSYLKDHEEAYTRAFNSANVVELATLAHEAEKSVSSLYGQLLANDDLIDFVEEILHKQHEKVLDMVLKADRYKTVPQDANEDKR